jgi:hypothetical protein
MGNNRRLQNGRKLIALGIIMIFASTTLVILASLIGKKFTKPQKKE